MTFDNKPPSPIAKIDALMVIGLFMGAFALAVLAAIFFTPGTRGKVTNLICGMMLLLTALAAILGSVFKKKKEEKK